MTETGSHASRCSCLQVLLLRLENEVDRSQVVRLTLLAERTMIVQANLVILVR